MLLGVVREAEPRVAATPDSVRALLRLGHEVVVEPEAGARAGFADQAYREAGARIGDPLAADVVLSLAGPGTVTRPHLRAGQTWIGLLAPATSPGLLDELAARGVTALSMDAVPRISRAQSMDVLSSMANIAGYRAVIEAAHEFGRFFTGQVTAAGKVPPARVLVAGAGVAGLAAIGAAGSLGAVVLATDPRPEVADQVASLGGEYLAVPDEEATVSTDGYAREVSADYAARAERLYAETLPGVDVLITTALIPGRPAPRLVTAAMLDSMAPGSVVVDMAAGSGGNVEGSVPGERVVTAGGVVVLGYTDLAARLPQQASRLYATNLVNLLTLLTPGKDGELVLDLEDPVQRAVTVTRAGEVTWPPPPVQVSAAPAAAPAAAAVAEAAPTSPSFLRTPAGRAALTAVGALALLLVLAAAPEALLPHLTVFALAVVVGFYVIGHVHHALHTPLMSVTNAISGIIVVGAVLQVGDPTAATPALVGVLGLVAILLASINIFGGFAVTRRMLGMFTRSTGPAAGSPGRGSSKGGAR
ncbi:Re/Si-specific NAD(P)(+) transhydrogenase subunit alpha [Nocardioides sp. GY 10127]|uniref:Re/Si-specific NAD(P)(+) transhydrogenase subunit alpha n=1 Tax=Nocardioides sp. GY 10127 TaxID=2569762 RepID=UPI0010A8E145|nr:Re/Si-specific NAD(P)(+) transhydrogenase subunit alpha [Nocardioides sp. GY 10127]TIC79102.1 Re/Si-specific NAD(P)(+) transhydrogenase subunit alpha [Nocardioides sp. GY 10127]